MKITFLTAVAVAVLAAAVFADTIHMKDGRKLEGEIVGETETAVHLKMKYGTMKIDRGDIERIEKTQPAEKKKPEPKTEPQRGEEPKTEEEKSQAGKRNPVTRPKVAQDPVEFDKKLRILVSKLGTGWVGILAEIEVVRMGEQAVATLVEIMQRKSRSDTHKRAIAKILGKIGSIDAVEPLMRELKECRQRQAWLRNACIDALGEIGDRRAVDLLIKVVKGKDKSSRSRAAEALGKIGDRRAVECLMELLEDKSTDNRCYAAAALGEMGEKSALPKLQKMWEDDNAKEAQRNDKMARVLQGVAFALVKLRNNREAFDYLVRGLTGGWKFGENHLSVIFLGKLGTKDAIKHLANNTGRIGQHLRMLVREALVKVGSPAVKPLMERMKGRYNKSRWEDISLILGEIGDRSAVKPLIEILEKGDVGVRAYAAQGLGLIGDNRAVAPLIKALEKKDEVLVRRAAMALGRIGDEKAVNPVIKLLSSKNKYVRDMAATSLGEIGPKAVEPLIKMLKDGNADVRGGAAQALGMIGDKKAAKALSDTLRDKEETVRMVTARSLGEIGSDEAVETLGKVLENKDVKMRKAVVDALGRTRNQKAVKHLAAALKDTDFSIRLAALEAMADLKCEEAVPHLEEALKDKNTFFRSQVPKALRRIGGKKAAEALLRALQTDDEDIHQNTIKALGKFPDREVIDKLDALYKAHPDKGKYLAALAEIGKPAVEHLLAALEKPDVGARSIVVRAIWRIRDDRVLVPLIRVALTDPNKQLRYTARRDLEMMRLSEWLAPLIEALKDDDERIRDFAAKALKSNTDQDFGADYDKWKDWYEKNKNK